MFRRIIFDAHLYIGLILSATILMLSVTGFYLNHQHDWFHKQNVSYMNPEYGVLTQNAIQQAQKGEKVLPEAVEKAATSNMFSLSDIDSINYSNHGPGYYYYVHLKDDVESIVVVTEQGEISKIYSDPAVKKWMTDLHVGVVDGFDFIWANDVTTIGVIILTLSGIILSIQILKAKSKRRKKKREVR